MSTVIRYENLKDDHFCRTCALKKTQLFSVFDIYMEEITFDVIIKDITEIKITEDNSALPTLICQDCKVKAISAFEFKRRTKDVDLYLNTALKNWISADQNIKLEQPPSSDLLDSEFTLPIPVDDNEIDELRNDFKENQNGAELKYESDESVLSSDNPDIPISAEVTAKNKTTEAPNIETKLNKLQFTAASVSNKQHSCTFCQQQFESKNVMKDHIYQHKDTKILHCALCKKLFLKSVGFQHNCSLQKNNVTNIDSIVYNETTETVISLSVLETIPSTVGSLDNLDAIRVCSICNELFLSEEEIKKHNDILHPEISKRCMQCQKVFATFKTAARHRNNCKQMEKKFSCKTCGEKFAFEISLNKHILRNHEGQSVSVKFMDTKAKIERQYQCDVCKRTFSSKDLLVKHTKTHMQNEKVYYECDICNKRFHRKDNLRSHKKVHELQRDKASTSNCLCLYCGRSFTNSSNLIVHMRRHTGEKPYKCDFCGKGFPRSSDLKWHRVSHTGEKPCVCRVCSKRFSRSNKLSRHMRIHTGYKPYKCTYCDKAFSQSYDLTLHIRRHTGDKPYICEVCGDRFIQGNALQNHRRVHGHFPSTGSQPAVLVNSDNDTTYTVHTTVQ